MNLVNLFGNKTKTAEPEYFLAVEIHESLIKSALWEILDGQPEIVNVGSYESWTDEESLINGVDSSLDQAIKIIKSQPKRVIFGLPDSWMEADKIHATKTKLITHLCKELGLDPIGVVTTNRAVAHYLKKREGMPPTVILLEVYTSKVAVSHVYLGEVKKTEEVARSGDLAHDVEEGLTRMDLPNYPARFILTNGNSLEEESQQITAFPWTDRLPFKHIPKVEVLPIDFSIKSIALTGGVEAVQFLGVEVAEEDFPSVIAPTEDSNLIVPVESPSTIEDLGFSYEETSAPEDIPVETSVPEIISEPEILEETSSEEPEYAFSDDTVAISPKPKLIVKLPSIPKFSFPKLPNFHISWLALLTLPLILILVMVGYAFLGQALVTIHFDPQKINNQLGIAISEASQSGIPTLIASKKTFSGTATEAVSTTGTATVGEKATGTITIANKSIAPIVLKAGTTISNDTGKYSYILADSVTVASASSDPIDPISGKATGVQVTAVKIGAEYNLTKDTIFSVDNFSKTISAAIAEVDFTGGTSRTVNAVSKADQEKVLGVAVEKIKSQVKDDSEAQTPGFKTLPLSDIEFDKKEFDHNLNEEATTVNLNLEGSLDALVYSEDALYDLVTEQIQDQIPTGSYTTKEATIITVENPTMVDGQYQAKVSVEATLYPRIDEEKLAGYIKLQKTKGIRHFFETIGGFQSLDVKISPPIPLITEFMPYRNIKFELVSN